MVSAHTTYKSPSHNAMNTAPFTSPAYYTTRFGSTSTSGGFSTFGTATPSASTTATMNPTTNTGTAATTANANAGATDNEAAASAHRFLSRYEGFDSARLSERTNDLERRFADHRSEGFARTPGFGGGAKEEEKKDGETPTVARPPPAATPADAGAATQTTSREELLRLLRTSTSLSHLLNAHHQLCIRSALTAAERLEKRRLAEKEEENAASDWEEQMRLMGSGGERFLNRALVPFHSQGKELQIVPVPQILTNSVYDQLPYHLKGVDGFLKSGGGGAAAKELITVLKGGIDAHSTDANEESGKQYLNGLELLESVISDSDTDRGNGTGGGDDGRYEATVAANALGACRFFSRQFLAHMTSIVREVQLDGSYAVADPAMTAVARDASAFASMVLGSAASGREGVWSRLFYCLRCGDLAAAKSVLGEEVDGAVVDLVGLLAGMQGEEDSIFGGLGPAGGPAFGGRNPSLLSPSNAIVRARRTVSDLYEGMKTRYHSMGGEQPLAAYKAACLAMLGGSESISEASILESSGLVKTVEDYLYASLWHALHLAEDGEVGLKRACDAVARLGTLVKQWGPSYFEQDDEMDESAASVVALASQGSAVRATIPRSGGWAYALPLLACQQYSTALAYLAEVGGGLGLMQATHAAVVMDAAGMEIADYTVESKDAVKDDDSQRLFPMLVSSFSASLQGVDVVAALKYIMILSIRGKIMKVQVQRLILETRQFEILAGKIEQDGSRSKAALDEYFSAKEISSLLGDAAGEAIRVGKAADAAELLVLAGRYSALFSLMNRELASYLVFTTEEEFNKRQFWFNAARQFHEIHLSGGKDYVQKNLAAEGNFSLGNTFQLLLNLVVFFDLYRDQKWKDAWDLVDCLHLFPKNDKEITIKVNEFSSLDSCVRREFHHVVIASMEALCHLYRASKQGSAGASSFQHSTIDQQLNELRTRARLLVTYARLVNLPRSGDVDTYAKLAQLENNM